MLDVDDGARELAADPATDLELLIKEARSRARRRWLRNTGIVGSLAAVFAGGAILSGRAPSGPVRPAGHDAARPAASPRAVQWPRLFVDTVATAEANTALQIRESATGRIVEPGLTAPRGAWSQVLAVAATAPDSFVVALRRGSPRDTSTTSCATQLYRLRLTTRGRVQALTAVGPALPGYVGSLAASAGGRMIGYSLIDGMCTKGASNYLGVLDTVTGRTRQWSEKSLLDTTAQYLGLTGGVSMTADGRELMFSATVSRSYKTMPAFELLILRTDARPGTDASRTVLRHAGNSVAFTQAIVSPSGRSFYLTSSMPTRKSSDRSRLLAYRTGSSKPYRTLATYTGVPPYGAALDPSGQWLLVPYKLEQGTQQTHWRGGLHLARINTTRGKRAKFFIPLAGFGSMSPPGGMFTAW
jgi:hypothetical protein